MTAEVAIPAQTAVGLARPTTRLSAGSLIRISLYWLGLSSVFIAFDQIMTGAMNAGVFGPDAKREVGTTLFRLTVMGSVIAALVQPTVGTLSDYTISRWGRRKPYIVIGSALDLVFLAAIAMSNTLAAIAVFVLLLQISANFAQGPFQGYIPDLVPEEQTGIASSLVGLFSVLGQVTGFAIASAAVATKAYALGFIGIGVVEFATMFSVVLRVPAGPPARDRSGRSWLDIVREAWSADILRHKDFLLIVISRLLILMGGVMLIKLSELFLMRTLQIPQEKTFVPNLELLVAVIVGNLIAVIPAGRVGDRIGRRPVVWAAALLAGAGMAMIATSSGVATMPLQAVIGAGLFGTGMGSFLSVDWALLTSVVPNAAGGRYMGISNVATAMAGVFAIATGGPLLDAMDASSYGNGPRAAFILAVVYLLLGMIPLIWVREPRRAAAEA